MTRKPKLTTEGQLQHLKDKGVLFSIDSEEKAKDYLTKNNNYFKLRSYRTNYSKRSDGTYVDLEFAYLRDLAIIDMRMRYCLLQMCLDIEHNVRVKLIKTIVESTDDGYTIVSNYLAANPSIKIELENNAKRSPYCRDLYYSYQNDMPVWVFVELAQFGRLNDFYRYVATMLSNKDMKNEFYILQEIRMLRNACAHSNCILNDLQSKPGNQHKPSRKMCTELGRIGISEGVRDRKLSNERIRQFVTLLYFYRLFVQSRGLLKHQTEQLHKIFFDRMNEHRDYYAKSAQVLTTFEFFQKIIDKWYPKAYNNTTVQKP